MISLEAIARAEAHSPFLAGLIRRNAPLVEAFSTQTVEAALTLADAANGATVGARLRRQRAGLMLVLALADLSARWSLEQIVEALSAFADAALNAAIEAAIAVRLPGAEPRGFAAIALGKHGSRELNYSSDIDPIFIYDPATLPHHQREEPAEAAVRIARTVVETLQTRDGDGFVFRVDLRLRPASEATPIALPIDAAIAHYESSALAWERAAFIRARAAAGDVALGQRFLAAVQPFVWRRSLDFGAIGELCSLTHAIRTNHQGQVFAPGYDVKRGRGGIREIEFYTQIHQLIHGGRDPMLRCGATLPALTSLCSAGRIGDADADALSAAYRELRTVEHRLQMIDDRQTHRLPEASDDLNSVAKLHGLAGGPALLALLQPHVERVAELYDAFDDAAPRGPTAADDLARSAFADGAAVTALIGRWRAGSVRAIRSPAAVAAFEALLPDLLDDLSRAPDPDAALARLDRLLGRLSTGINLFRLLDAQPALRVLLVDILSHAPILADLLAARPALFDRLVDRTALGELPTTAVLASEMDAPPATPLEAVLDRVRHIVGEFRFALGVQIVAGAADPLNVAAGYARVAEACVAVVTRAVVASFELAHGRVPDSELVVVALGRLGGGLLTHASDLDLIYLFTGDYAAMSDGAKPLGATQYYNRLGQRVSAALSAPTSVGALYDVDTRLRPSGAQGPLVVSLDSFKRYQNEAAWTWEHMALTRARTLFGSPEARVAVQHVCEAVMTRTREPTLLAAEVVAMRADIATHKPANGPLDVKLGSGGLVDLEFSIHRAQLASGRGRSPDLRVAIDDLVAAGLLDAALAPAHDLLTRLLVTLRLIAPDLAVRDPASQNFLARACGASDWTTLLARLDEARHSVRRAWQSVVEGSRA